MEVSLSRQIEEIRSVQLEMAERLSRIEGFLGIGMPAEAAEQAPGAHLAHNEGPAASHDPGTARSPDEQGGLTSVLYHGLVP